VSAPLWSNPSFVLPRVGSDAEVEVLGQSCPAAEKNGRPWATVPCVKVEWDKIRFNDHALTRMPLRVGGAVLVGRLPESHRYLYLSPRPRPARTLDGRREGLYVIRNAKGGEPCRSRKVASGFIEQSGGLPLTRLMPRLAGWVFRVWFHPLDHNQLLCDLDDGYMPDVLSRTARLSMPTGDHDNLELRRDVPPLLPWRLPAAA
jgi:hypothetical protein